MTIQGLAAGFFWELFVGANSIGGLRRKPGSGLGVRASGFQRWARFAWVSGFSPSSLNTKPSKS